MKKSLSELFFIVILLPFLLWGCPYEAKAPLGESGKAPIDRELLGEWKNTEQGEPFTMTIQQFNEHEFLISGAEFKNGICNCEAMRAFVTVIQGERFLNVQEIKGESESRGWWIAKYTVSGDTLRAWIVEDKLFTKPFTSSRELYRFIKKNLHNKELYGDASPPTWQRIAK
jgi:hypothetical protein